MISILPSEGLAPSQSAPKQNKVSEPSSKSDETSFASLVSRDKTDADTEKNSDAPSSDTAISSQAETLDASAGRKTRPSLSSGDLIDPALAQSVETPAPQADADAARTGPPLVADTALPGGEIALPGAATADADRTTLGEANSAVQNNRARAEISPGQTPTDIARTTDIDPATPSRQATLTRAALEMPADTATKPTPNAAEMTAPTALQQGVDGSAEDTLRIIRQQDGADLSGPDVKLAQLASDADLASSVSKSALATATGEARIAAANLGAPESMMAVSQPATTPAAVSASGLTPVAPSIPMASPSEINSIILNAVKNGAEPREQLIVQLDPPELGRVAIDFKFDAQGVQQITVTSENPEALRRLRELHFELTEALKEHGLSEQNLTFRQQADDQSQSGWQTPEFAGSGSTVIAGEESQQATLPPLRSNVAYARQDRLDLTL